MGGNARPFRFPLTLVRDTFHPTIFLLNALELAHPAPRFGSCVPCRGVFLSMVYKKNCLVQKLKKNDGNARMQMR